MPPAPPQLVGLISLRSQIAPLINLRTRLGLEPRQPIKHPYHLVVNTPHAIARFEVDDMGDDVDVPSQEFVPPPDSVTAIDASFLDGVFPLENEISTVLNVDAILDTERLSRSQTAGEMQGVSKTNG